MIKLIGTYYRFLRNGITKQAPVQLTLFVTSRCNIRCKMCFYWEPIESPTREEITLPEVEAISKSLPKFFWLLIGGGEPFVRQDLPQIVHAFYRQNGIRHLSIPTNGTFPKQIVERTEEILRLCPGLFFNLNLSLNGLEKDHDELCQTEGVFKKLLVTYEGLCELKRRYKNLGLGINITHTCHSQEHLLTVIDFVADKLTGVDNISLGMVRGRPKDSSSMNVDVKFYKRAVERIEALAVQRKLRTFRSLFGGIAFAKDMIMRRLIAKTMKSGYQIPCFAGRISLVIDEKTNVYPCEMLPAVGNLRDSHLDARTILRGAQLAEAVEKISCENCFCTHECFYSTNILFNPNLWGLLLWRYVQFRARQFVGAKDAGDFDDLTLPDPHVQTSYSGQRGGLYKGRNFAQLTASERKTTTRPF